LKSVDTQIDFPYALPTMPKLWKRPNTGFYYVTWQESGKSQKRSLKTKEKRIAKKLFNAFKRDLLLNKVSRIGGKLNITLSRFRDEYLEHLHATKKAAGTYEGYQTALNKALACWGDLPVGHITTRHIDRLIADMSKAGLKAPTINKNRRHLKAALNKACKWKYLKEPVEFPGEVEEEERLRYLTKEELAKVLAQIDDAEFADVVLLGAYSGLRSGEILRLTRDDIDNPDGFLRISSKQKNKKESWIPINETTRTILTRCIARGHGKMVRFRTRQTVSKYFKKAARAAGFEIPRFHDLRHTFGSHLAMLNIGEKTIQDLMRHKSMASTLIYTHVSPKHLTEASNKINYGPMTIPKRKAGQKQDSGS
jgi:integrase